MAKYTSGRQKNLKIGISSYSENLTSIEVIGRVGIATTNATSRLYVVGDGYFTGVVTATTFSGTLSGFVSSAGIATYATNAGIATYATNAGIATYATNAGIATYATNAGIATYATNAGIATYATNAGIATYATNAGIATYATNAGIATYATNAGIATYATNAGIATYATNAGIATYATNAGVSTYATNAGIATYATNAGIATYATNAGIATYATNAGIATYATNAGVSTYATNAGIATYATNAGIATYATNAGIATYATNAGIATYATNAGVSTYATNAGVSTYATNAGVSTSVIGGIASVTQLSVSGISTFTNGPVLIGGGTSTGTAGQVLQVTGINSSVYIGGSVGIGTTNPTATLTVAGNSANILIGKHIAASNTITLNGSTALADYNILSTSTNNLFINRPSGKTITFAQANSTHANFDTSNNLQLLSGNLGIGNFTPTYAIDAGAASLNKAGRVGSIIFGTAGTSYGIIGYNAKPSALNAWVYDVTDNASWIQFLDGGHIFYRGVVGNAGNAITPLESGRFNSIGNLGIGTTNPTSKLHVVGDVSVSGIITTSELSTGASGTGINITTNTISGPATLTIDPAAVGDNTGAVRIKGDLYVDGTQFIVNSTTIELADFNVGIATTVGTNALLDGAGIGIGSTGIRKTLTWNNSSTALKSSENFDVASGKVYKINGTSVLSNDTLGSDIVNSSLTSVGTLGNLSVGNVNSTGIVTATSFSGNASSATFATNAGIATFATSSGIATFATNAGVSTYATSAGIATYATSAGITTSGDYAQSGATSAYATKRVLQYNETTKAVTYSNTLDAVRAYITGYGPEIHVSPVAFDDTGNGTIGDPVKTIARAQVLATLAFETTGVGERKTIILHPGDYVENVTIDTQFTVLTTHELVGKNTTLSGTLTITKGCTIDGLKMNNLVISATSATGSVDIIGCTVTTATTKTSSAYTVFRGCDLSSSSLSITGTGTVILVGGNYFTVTVNNAAAAVLSKAVVSMGPVTLTAGTLQLSDTLVYSATNTSNAITQSAGSVLTLNNSQTLIPTLTNVARNSFGGFYSILHSVYDKPNSTFGGTSLNSISYSQYINVDRIGIGTTNATSSLYVVGDEYVTGVVTATTFYGTFSGNSATATYATDAGIATYATNAGIATYATNAGVSTSVIGGIGSITQLQVTGISTFANGPVLIGTATSTGTASQPLQVTGGAYVSGSVGIGTTNPTSKLQVSGNVLVSGIVTATTFVGTLTGTATSTTNIPNLTGDITSANTVTTLATVNSNVGSFGSQTLIPVVTVNAKGLVTAVTTAAVGSGLTVSGDSGSENIDLLTETLTISGGTNLTSSAASNTVTVNLDPNISLTSVVASGVVTATSGFSGNVNGTATSTTNIPNLTGAITSVNTITSLGSFTSAQLATALTDETGSGSAVFATSPILITPSLGIATATSINVSGVVTATTFSGNASSATYATNAEIATYATNAGVSTNVIGGIGSITQLQVIGISTFTNGPILVGTATSTGTASQPLQVTGGAYVSGSVGIGTTNPTVALDVIGDAKFTGVVTALSFSGNASSASYAPIAGIATYATNAGIATYSTSSGIATYATNAGIATYAVSSGIALTIYATNAGIATYSTSSGIATYATIAGIATYATNAGIATYSTSSGIATYATNAGIATSVIGGIGSITQLQVTGISTFTNGPVLIGSGTSTGTASQPLQVSGGAYVSGSVGIGTTNPTSKLEVLDGPGVTNGQLKLRTTGDVGIANTTVFLRLNDLNGNAGYFGFGGTANQLDIWNYKNGDVRIGTNSNEVLRVISSGFVGIGTTNPTANLQVGVGTAGKSPLKLTAGTNLTTAQAGAIEYDGTVFYATPNATSGRGLSPSSLIYRLNANLAGNRGTSAQNSLGVSLTVPASTVYLFEFYVAYTKATGTGLHNFVFGLGGTATFNNALWLSTVPAFTGGGVTYTAILTSLTTFTYNSISTGSLTLAQSGKGTISVNASGTLNLNYTLSADPGAAYSTLAGSYLMLTPIGAAGAATSIGTWA